MVRWMRWHCHSDRRIRNPSPGSLRPSTLPLCHGGSPQYWIFTNEQERSMLFLSLFKPSRCIKASFYILESSLDFPIIRGFVIHISMKLVYQYMTIFFTSSPTSNHLHPLQVENCDSNSRLVVDEDDNVNSGLKGLTWRSRLGLVDYDRSL